MSGVVLQSIRLKDVGVFKELHLTDLDKAGFVTVQGYNHDSPDLANNRNGVGKSLMFGAIPNMMYEADPLAMGKREKTNMLAKGSEIEIGWIAPNGDRMQITQTATKYHVFKNDEDQKVAIQSVARDMIAKTFPLSKDDFYSHCFVQTQIPHPFQRATPADRLTYLTSLFNLEIYDRVRAEIKVLLDEAKDAEKVVSGLADMLDVTERKKKSVKVTKKDRKRLKELSKEISSLQEIAAESYEKAVDTEQLIKSAKRWNKIQKAIEELGGHIEKPKKLLKKLRETLDDHKQYSRYVEALEEYKEEHEKLTAQIGDVPEGDADVLQEKYNKSVKELSKLEDQMDDTLDAQDEYEDYQDEYEGIKIKLSKSHAVERTQEAIEESSANCRTIVNMYEELTECIDGKDCPTCGQKVNIKQMEKAAKKAAEQYKQDKKDLEVLALRKKFADLKAKPVEKPDPSPQKLKAAIRTLDDKVGDLSAALRNIKKHERLIAELKALTKPKKVEKPKKDKKEIKAEIERIEEYLELVAALSSLDEPTASLTKLTMRFETAQKKHKKSQKQAAKLSEEQNELSIRIQESDHHEQTAADIREKVEKLRPLIEEREVLEALYKAYAPQALKLKAMESRLQELENNLNINSHLVFAEPMEFKLFTTKRGIGATVTRKVGGQTTDISIMSGAETNCFRLLWVPSVLPFVPAHRRLNVLVLDEPEDKCSPAVKEHLINNYLPLIRQVVPNVFWITPQDVNHSSDSEWTVDKRGGSSTLTQTGF